MQDRYKGSFFIDSSDPRVIMSWERTGIIDGVTTNPQIMLDGGVTWITYESTVREIAGIMGGRSVSVELISDRRNLDEQLDEARGLNSLAENITIKVPFTPEDPNGLELMHRLVHEEGMSVNATVMMNYEQLVLATAAMRGGERVSFVSLFWGRAIEDWAKRTGEGWAPERLRVGNSNVVNSHPGVITREMARRLEAPGFERINLIVGSVRNASMVGEALVAGAHVVTVPADILTAMLYSRRSLETLRQFDDAWREILGK